MLIRRRQSALLLALGLVLVASPAAPASMLPVQAQLSLDALLTATARSASDKQAVEALVAGLRDTVRFLKQKPRPAFAACLDEQRQSAWLHAVKTTSRWDWPRALTRSEPAVLGGRLNLPPPLI